MYVVSGMLILALTALLPMNGAQSARQPSTVAKNHIRNLIRELPTNSLLRSELVQGARGDGIRYHWMDQMRMNAIKRAVATVSIHYNREGRPKEMHVENMQYFDNYVASKPISDIQRLNAIRKSGLARELTDVALQRAANGSWVDLPHPKPRPFVGGVQIEIFSDEWLPSLPVLYCAGKYCLERQ